MPTIPQIVRGAQTTVKVLSAVSGIAPVVAPFVKRGSGKISQAKKDREKRRAERLEARVEAKTRAALESADRELEATRVEELWARFGRRGRLDALGYIGGPGCFAILTFAPGFDDEGGTPAGEDIRGYLIGAAPVMGKAVHEELSGAGDKDVYADYKYGQPMSVLFFPCLPDDFAKVMRALRSSFPPAKAYG